MSAENTNAGGGEPMSLSRIKDAISYNAHCSVDGYARVSVTRLLEWRHGLSAALSAHSTGSAGVAAEPVAGDEARLREVLVAVRDRIASPVYGGIDDTFWMIPTVTVVDYIDTALATAPPPPAGGGKTERPASKIIAGLQDAVAFAQGDESRGRIVHPAPASPAGDLISLSAVLARFAACVFNDNGDVTISTVSLTSEDWLALDRAYRSGRLVEAAPAAPRKEPSAGPAYVPDDLTGTERLRWIVGYYGLDMPFGVGTRLMEVADHFDAALLAPADRGETQAEDATDDLISGLGKPRVRCGSGDREFHVRLVYDDLDAAWNAHSALVRALAPSPDQNRGEPDQGGEVS